VKTAVPALEPLLVEIHQKGRAGRHVRGGEDADALIPARSAGMRRSVYGAHRAAGGAPLHAPRPAELRPSTRGCTARLVHEKYNPKINDRVASLFADLHPKQPQSTVQGALTLLAELEGMLAKLHRMDAVTLQPARALRPSSPRS